MPPRRRGSRMEADLGQPLTGAAVRPRPPAAMASAARTRAAATAKVALKPPATNRAPIRDAPLTSPRLRDRASRPETSPRRPGLTCAIAALLLAVWNKA